MKSRRKKILLGVLALFVALQFVPLDRSVPEIQPENDFLTIVNAPEDIASVIKSSCYDCHSYHTKYPWYANVAPASILLGSHIKGGRQHLNFSEWGTYSKEKAIHKLEECMEMVRDGKMPMISYTNLHSEARLTEAQTSNLVQWFSSAHENSPK